MDNVLENMTSVSEVKKSPTSVFEKARANHQPVIVLNNNSPIGSMVDLAYIKEADDIKKENELLKDQLNDAKIALEVLYRLQNDDGIRVSNEDALGEYFSLDTSDIEDEWE
jgi:PHD/YefM family antitoxin component YafN of YafNO toxin-antitoxin module